MFKLKKCLNIQILRWGRSSLLESKFLFISILVNDKDGKIVNCIPSELVTQYSKSVPQNYLQWSFLYINVEIWRPPMNRSFQFAQSYIFIFLIHIGYSAYLF